MGAPPVVRFLLEVGDDPVGHATVTISYVHLWPVRLTEKGDLLATEAGDLGPFEQQATLQFLHFQNGDGLAGEVRVTFCVVPRREVPAVTRLIHEANPEAYVTLDQTATVDLAARHDRDVRK